VTFHKWSHRRKLEGFSERAQGQDVGANGHDCTPPTRCCHRRGSRRRACRELVDLARRARRAGHPNCCAPTDADAVRTMIYQTFQEETKARGRPER